MSLQRSGARQLAVLLALAIILWPALPAMAEGYTTAYSGWTESGKEIQANNCFVTLSLSNGSTALVHVLSPNYPDASANLPVGQSYYYFNALRIYLADVNQSTGQLLVNIASMASTPAAQGGTGLYCDVPGQTVLGGDTISFPIVIKNNGQDDKTYSLSATPEPGWSAWFTVESKGVYKVSVPASGSKTVNLMVQAPGNARVGESRIKAFVDSMETDVYAYVTSVNSSVDVSANISAKIASVGDKIVYQISLKNRQSRENVYKLSVTGLPDSWYYRYKESPNSADEMAEVVVPASGGKDILLEIAPSLSAPVGDYNFTAVVESPDGVKINKSLTAKLKSGVSMTVSSAKLAYDAKPGQPFDIEVYVANAGAGDALTNVHLEASAPDGWTVQVSPNSTNSIKAGASRTFDVNVVPPGNIVASDYEVSINVKSDQAEKEKDYRITVKTDSYIPYIGGAIIVMVLAGLAFMYKKYGRR